MFTILFTHSLTAALDQSLKSLTIGPYLGFRLELASKVLGLGPNDSSTGNYN